MEPPRSLVLVVASLACMAAVARGSTDGATVASHAVDVVTTVTTDLAEDSAQMDNFYLRNHTLRSLQQVPSLVVCGQKCASLGGCRSLNYRRASATCELNGASRTDFPEDLVGSDGGDNVVYLGAASPIIMEIKRSAVCPCCDNECRHDAYCVPSDEATRGYKCVCSNGWTGVYCENMNARWSEWTNWSACSRSCGSRKRTRMRQCIGSVANPDSCNGDSVEYRDCWNEAQCAEWSSWTDAGLCSTVRSCGYGTVNRTRVCRGNRTDCPGADSQTARCGSVSCEAPWRLVGGSRPGEGRLEVFNTVLGVWGTVCSDGWHRWDTDVACKTLGFQPPPAYPEPSYEDLCDEGWLHHEGSCYKGGGSLPSGDFTEAQDICRQLEAHLVSILTEDENTFVRDSFPHPSKLWLGAHSRDEENGGYLSSLRWTDGSFPGFRESFMVYAVEEVEEAEEALCLSMDNGGGDWKVKQCSETKGVVCKKYPHFSMEFGPGEGAIHLTHMDCRGCEDHLNQCHHGNWHNATSCSHSHDVGLKCSVVCPTYETNARTGARFAFKPQDPTSIRVDFTVRAAGTIQLVLSGGESLAEAVYTITLSAASTSSIYRHASATYHDVKVVQDLLDANEQRGLWITKTNDVIQVGRASEETPLLEWTDDQSASVPPALYVGFASSQQAEWQFSSFCGKPDSP